MILFSFDCGTCTNDYFAQDLDGGDPGTYGKGLRHTFPEDGIDVGETREYFIHAEVSQGANIYLISIMVD